jgi:LAS superfamily LD-carboxypeptidase LdcB
VPADVAALTGQTDAHLCSAADADLLGARVHRDVVQPFLELKAAARQAGFDLAILSGFRDFDRQLSIWNRKATGQQAVLDSNAEPLDIGKLSEKELAFAILRWSALPGASRHHWGTDLDVFDAAARPEGYEIELIPEEVNSGGMFGPLHDWLGEMLAAGSACGFFRPYESDRNGVAPERWHLSHALVASSFERQLTLRTVRDTIQTADIALKAAILESLDEIFERFVTNICRPRK